MCQICTNTSKRYYSHTGRPSVDPELLNRMLLVGYCFGIRLERRLCDEAHLNYSKFAPTA
jgi:transposase